MNEKFAKIMGVIVFFIVLIGLLGMVGNPAKEETYIIFIVAGASGIFIFKFLRGDKKEKNED